MNNEEIEELLALMAQRVSSLERIFALQHQENGRLYAAVQGLQTAFEKLVEPAQNAERN